MFSIVRKIFLPGMVLFAFSFPVLTEELVRPGNTRPGLTAQPGPPHPPAISRSSGYIFAGTVQSVERVSPQPRSVATVQISFHVDEAIRGVRTGQMLVIREWAGLWNSGERYRPGERVLLFLYPPSKLGLTSPVGGTMGRFAVGPRGRVRVPPGRVRFLPGPWATEGLMRGSADFSPREFVRMVLLAEAE